MLTRQSNHLNSKPAWSLLKVCLLATVARAAAASSDDTGFDDAGVAQKLALAAVISSR